VQTLTRSSGRPLTMTGRSILKQLTRKCLETYGPLTKHAIMGIVSSKVPPEKCIGIYLLDKKYHEKSGRVSNPDREVSTETMFNSGLSTGVSWALSCLNRDGKLIVSVDENGQKLHSLKIAPTREETQNKIKQMLSQQ
jgi:hypothetical protein